MWELGFNYKGGQCNRVCGYGLPLWSTFQKKIQTLNSTRLLLIEEPFAIFKTTEVTGKHRLCPQGFKKLRIRCIGLGFVTRIGYIELRGKCLKDRKSIVKEEV